LRLAELEPISYKTKDESTNIKRFLLDAKFIFQSFIDDHSSFPLSRVEKQRTVTIMKQINGHLNDVIEKKFQIQDEKYFLDLNDNKTLRNFGLTGNELKMKLKLLQNRRDALILSDRILFHVFSPNSENVIRGLFEPELLEVEYNEVESKKRRSKTLQWNEQINEQKKGRWERFVDWLGISKTILKSIFGFFGAGEALGELLDFLEAVAKKSVK